MPSYYTALHISLSTAYNFKCIYMNYETLDRNASAPKDTLHSACVYERDAKSNKFMVLFIGKSQNDDRVIAEELRN